MTELAGKRIVITGAASGIGRASSLLAAEQGAAIVAVDNAEAVQATVADIVAVGDKAVAVQADISIETEVKAFVVRCIDEYGGIDGLYAKESLIGQVNPTARAGDAQEIAAMACFLLSDAASYVNGQAIAVDGGLSASHPWAYPQTK